MKNDVNEDFGSSPLLCTDDPFAIMEHLRGDGWCVVIKCLPKDVGWQIEGSRSEYDSPCPDQYVGHNKWCCEAQDMTWPDGRYRHSEFAMRDTPLAACRAVLQQVIDSEARWREHQGV